MLIDVLGTIWVQFLLVRLFRNGGFSGLVYIWFCPLGGQKMVWGKVRASLNFNMIFFNCFLIFNKMHVLKNYVKLVK